VHDATRREATRPEPGDLVSKGLLPGGLFGQDELAGHRPDPLEQHRAAPIRETRPRARAPRRCQRQARRVAEASVLGHRRSSRGLEHIPAFSGCGTVSLPAGGDLLEEPEHIPPFGQCATVSLPAGGDLLEEPGTHPTVRSVRKVSLPAGGDLLEEPEYIPPFGQCATVSLPAAGDLLEEPGTHPTAPARGGPRCPLARATWLGGRDHRRCDVTGVRRGRSPSGTVR
jgi:hypothetical protein